MSPVRLALGPLLYYWPRARVEAFYEEALAAPVDIVYLGEVVCGKRHELRLSDWIGIGRRLAAAGREVVLSSLALPESETDLRVLRRLVENGEFAIEANDMGAVHLAAQARVPFVIGPHVNAYNPATVAYLRRCGAMRWVAPVELSRASLTDVTRLLAEPIPTEVFAYGRVPLAFSARCFTARAHDLAKDDCAFRCLDDPDGLAMATVDGQPLLALNGVQTQSAQPYSLAPVLGEVAAAGVDVLRISPQSRHAFEVLRLFREGLDARIAPGLAAARIAEATGTRATDGFWAGRPGLETVAPLSA